MTQAVISQSQLEAVQRRGRMGRGDMSGVALHVRSGIDDDPRKDLTPRDELYSLAEHAWCLQDQWTLEEHRSFWIGALPLWPKKAGQRHSKDTRGFWARTLREAGVPDSEIAEVLGVDCD